MATARRMQRPAFLSDHGEVRYKHKRLFDSNRHLRVIDDEMKGPWHDQLTKMIAQRRKRRSISDSTLAKIPMDTASFNVFFISSPDAILTRTLKSLFKGWLTPDLSVRQTWECVQINWTTFVWASETSICYIYSCSVLAPENGQEPKRNQSTPTLRPLEGSL